MNHIRHLDTTSSDLESIILGSLQFPLLGVAQEGGPHSSSIVKDGVTDGFVCRD